tara:strand:+ start:1702 stop:2169 length:468 start_codon:yes stop_codon:yes gene_type:complete
MVSSYFKNPGNLWKLLCFGVFFHLSFTVFFVSPAFAENVVMDCKGQKQVFVFKYEAPFVGKKNIFMFKEDEWVSWCSETNKFLPIQFPKDLNFLYIKRSLTERGGRCAFKWEERALQFQGTLTLDFKSFKFHWFAKTRNQPAERTTNKCKRRRSL